MFHGSQPWFPFLALATITWFLIRDGEAEPNSRPIIRNWSVADFGAVISVGLEGYRDFENGRRQFERASCSMCHRFAGQGSESPRSINLSLVASQSPQELLEAILSPDAQIKSEDAVHIFKLAGGHLIEGLVDEQSDTDYRVIPDPRKPDQTVVVVRSTVVTRRLSEKSAMPSGLLDTLEEEDVLDLLAYLLSDGKREDPMFMR